MASRLFVPTVVPTYTAFFSHPDKVTTVTFQAILTVFIHFDMYLRAIDGGIFLEE